jgi:hypothetical protein
MHHQYLNSVKIALRVLTAIVEKRCPDLADVRELESQSSLPADAPADELAWDVMRQALKKRDAATGGK